MEINYINGGTSTERMTLSKDRSIKFNQNTKGENPLYSVQYFLKKNDMRSLGSVPKEQIPIVANAVSMLSEECCNELSFVSRAKSMIAGRYIIEPSNQSEFERLLAVINEEL